MPKTATSRKAVVTTKNGTGAKSAKTAAPKAAPKKATPAKAETNGQQDFATV